MQKTLIELSKRMLLLNEGTFREEQIHSTWLGEVPATSDEIKNTVERLGMNLPQDYLDFLAICNGFPQSHSTTVTFLSVNKIDFLRNIDADLVEIWLNEPILAEIGEALRRSILIGGLEEEQYFLLIPPYSTHKKWRYWLFANWMPGEWEFKDLKSYLKNDLAMLKEETKGLRLPKPKQVVDYSLRDAVFMSDWEKVFSISTRFLKRNIHYAYFNKISDLFALSLMAADKLGNYAELLLIFNQLQKTHLQEMVQHLIIHYKIAARKQIPYVELFQVYKWKIEESPLTLADIESQILENRPDLLKPENAPLKTDYQLYFLYDNANKDLFIPLYEAHRDIVSYQTHLKAAVVYAKSEQKASAQKAVEKYFEAAFAHRPLEPFLIEGLAAILDESFGKEMLLKMRENGV